MIFRGDIYANFQDSAGLPLLKELVERGTEKDGFMAG
jgi:hypothetical protein